MSLVILIFAVVVVVILLIATLVVVLMKKAKQRSADMAKAASRLGLSYTQKPDRRVANELGQSFELFNKGRGELRNLLEGSAGGHHVIAFDYTYVVEKMDRSRSVIHTATLVDLKDKVLPIFQLGRQDLGGKVKGAMGMHDIKIGHDEEFIRTFRLVGTDVPATEAAFNPEVTAYFREKLSAAAAVECDGKRLLYYQSGCIGVDQMQQFVERAAEVARLFEKPAEY